MSPGPGSCRTLVANFPGQGWDFGLRRHPFHDEESQRGARYCVYNNRLMAVCFEDSDIEREYWLLRQRAGALHTGEHTIEIGGPDATRLLDRVCSRDVAAARVGRCSYQLVCYPDGGLLVDGVLLRLAEQRYWFVQAQGGLHNWLIAHATGLDVTIHDPDVFVSQVQGPKSLQVLAAAADDGLPEPFRYFDQSTVRIAGQTLIVTRTGFTNELGWEFYLEPRHEPLAIWARIKQAGAPFGLDLAGLDAFDPRRIEAGILNAGSDFDATTTPYAVGLGAFVDLDKADFVGCDALARAERQCRLQGLRCAGGVPGVRGTVSANGTPVGRMTSGAWSPYLQCGVGYLRVDATPLAPGSAVQVQCMDASVQPAEVCELPMYDPERRIPRGLESAVPAGPQPADGA